MKRWLSIAVAAIAVVVGSTTAESAITLTAGTNNFGAAPNGALINATAFGAGTITIDLDFLKAGGPITLGFNVASTVDAEVVDFTVTVNTRNSITPFNTGLGFAMNGFDALVSDVGGGPTVGLVSAIAPTSNTFGTQLPVSANPLAAMSGYRFGGWLGGGGELYNAATAINTFRIRITGDALVTANAFNLVFTANPEPATLLLGSLALIPGGIAIRRRRQTQA